MSPLYVYALVAAAPPPEALGAGLAGEPIRVVPCEGVLAAVGEMEGPPELAAPALRAHDATVRRIAAATAALLPARFGSMARDDEELREALRPRATALRDALEMVRGCEQMTLRFAAAEGADPAVLAPRGALPEVGGPGTRYLASRRAEEEPRAIPEIARVLEAAAPLVRGQRLETHHRPPLLASAYHLVARGDLEPYRGRVAAAAAGEPRLRVLVSGPWPAYAFGPRELA